MLGLFIKDLKLLKAQKKLFMLVGIVTAVVLFNIQDGTEMIGFMAGYMGFGTADKGRKHVLRRAALWTDGGRYSVRWNFDKSNRMQYNESVCKQPVHDYIICINSWG